MKDCVPPLLDPSAPWPPPGWIRVKGEKKLNTHPRPFPVARPPLKAVGGKTFLLPEILPRLPAKIKTYYEPFVGGGAVFFALAAEKRFNHALIGDANAEFITTYAQIQRDVDGVIRALKKHVYDEKHYYEVRAQDPLKLSHNARAARLIYLNKTCFPPGSEVLMENEEMVAIEDVPVGAKLWGGRTVKEKLRRHYSGKMTTLKVQGLPTSIRMTSDHPVLCIKKSGQRQERRGIEELTKQIALKEARTLEVGDYVLLPRSGVEKAIDWREFWPSENVVGPQAKKRKFSPDDKLIARLLGYYLADGYTRLSDIRGPRGGRGGQVHITTCTEEWSSSTGKARMVRDISNISKKVFDTISRVAASGGRVEISIGNVLLARFVERLVPGKTWSKDPEKRRTKRLHKALMTAPIEIQRELLYGWMLGDGGLRVRDGGRVELFGTTVIPELARQMHRIAMRCGFSPTWRVSHPNGLPTQIVTLSVAEEVRVLGFDVAKPKSAPRGRRKLLTEYMAARVTEKIEIEYEGAVHNLEVDGDHLLCVDGIVSHNCFNGLYRVNRKGQFNVPFGKYTNPTICDEENLRAVAAVLKNEGITLGDFAGSVRGAKRGDAVYFDCPYAPLSETANFTAYTAGGFGPADQERLRDVAKKLDARGVHVLLSNSDTPFVRKLYKGFKIEKVEAPRRVNSKGGKRGNVGELLISGKS